jgi:hypothetical protein
VGEQADFIMDVVRKYVNARDIVRAAGAMKRLKELSDLAENGEVSADRLTTGTLQALVEIIAGSTHVSDTGVALELLTDPMSALNSNDANEAARISPYGVGAGNRGTLSFYNDSSALDRGLELVQSTTNTTYQASVLLAAIKSATSITALQNAYIAVWRNIAGSPEGEIFLSGLLTARTMIDPQYRSGWLSIAAGATRSYSHGLGSRPILHQVLGSPNSDGSSSVNVPNPASTLNIRAVDDTSIDVENTLTVTRYVRVCAWKDPYP